MRVEGASAQDPLGFGYAKNISLKGLAVDAQALVDGKEAPQIGDQLNLTFKLPKGGLVISTSANVVRVDEGPNGPWLAVEFMELPLDYEAEIQRYVAFELAR